MQVVSLVDGVKMIKEEFTKIEAELELTDMNNSDAIDVL